MQFIKTSDIEEMKIQAMKSVIKHNIFSQINLLRSDLDENDKTTFHNIKFLVDYYIQNYLNQPEQ